MSSYCIALQKLILLFNFSFFSFFFLAEVAQVFFSFLELGLGFWLAAVQSKAEHCPLSSQQLTSTQLNVACCLCINHHEYIYVYVYIHIYIWIYILNIQSINEFVYANLFKVCALCFLIDSCGAL